MEDNQARQPDKFDKKDIFTTPEDYFESFETRLASRLEGREEKKVVILRSAQVWKWGLAAAAVFAAVVLFIPGLYRSEAPSADDMLAEVPAEQCLAYLKQSDLELTDILLVSDLSGLMETDTNIPLDESLFDNDDTELLYEHYGVTDDEKLQSL